MDATRISDAMSESRVPLRNYWDFVEGDPIEFEGRRGTIDAANQRGYSCGDGCCFYPTGLEVSLLLDGDTEETYVVVWDDNEREGSPIYPVAEAER